MFSMLTWWLELPKEDSLKILWLIFKWRRYSPFHKTLPRSSLQMHWISVRFLWNGRCLNFQPLEKNEKKVIEVWAKKTFIKEVLFTHFWENCKKVKIQDTGPKKAQFVNVLYQKRCFPFLWLYFYLFLHFSQKWPKYIDTSGHFVFY